MLRLKFTYVESLHRNKETPREFACILGAKIKRGSVYFSILRDRPLFSHTNEKLSLRPSE